MDKSTTIGWNNMIEDPNIIITLHCTDGTTHNILSFFSTEDRYLDIVDALNAFEKAEITEGWEIHNYNSK